jgi:hypothetical protein
MTLSASQVNEVDLPRLFQPQTQSLPQNHFTIRLSSKFFHPSHVERTLQINYQDERYLPEQAIHHLSGQ